MSRKRKKGKKGKKGKKSRMRSSQKFTSDLFESLSEDNWQQKVVEATGITYLPLKEDFSRCLQEHEKTLGLGWTKAFLWFNSVFSDDPSKAIQIYHSRLSSYPKNCFIELIVGDLYMSLGKFLKAKQRYEAAVASAPQIALSHRKLGIVYYLLGLFEKAVEQQKKAIEVSTETERELRARSYYNLGMAYYQFYRDSQTALTYIRKALENMPDYPQAMAALEDLKSDGQ